MDALVGPLHIYKEIESPYWVVAFKHKEERAKMLKKWCYENFGPGLGRYRVDNSPFVHRWVDDTEWGEIRLSREEDVNWFRLRWL